MAWQGFNECRARIYRAKSHGDALAARWNTFIEDEPYSGRIHMEGDGAGTLTIAPYYEQLPEEFAFELGEFLYNLRSALDSAIYAAAVHEIGEKLPGDGKNLGFPICATPGAFKSARGQIEPLTDKSKVFVESVQPYNATKLLTDPYVGKFEPAYHVLSIINDWARKDRHRKLHMLGTWRSRVTPNIIIPEGCALEYLDTPPGGILESEDVVATFKLSGFVDGMDVQANPQVTLDIAVDEPPYPCVDWDTLGERVARMLRTVYYIVDGLESTLVKPSAVL